MQNKIDKVFFPTEQVNSYGRRMLGLLHFIGLIQSIMLYKNRVQGSGSMVEGLPAAFHGFGSQH